MGGKLDDRRRFAALYNPPGAYVPDRQKPRDRSEIVREISFDPDHHGQSGTAHFQYLDEGEWEPGSLDFVRLSGTRTWKPVHNPEIPTTVVTRVRGYVNRHHGTPVGHRSIRVNDTGPTVTPPIPDTPATVRPDLRRPPQPPPRWTGPVACGLCLPRQKCARHSQQ